MSTRLESHPVPDAAVGAADARISVLHVLVPALAGGLERVVRTLTRAQAARGHSVTVAAVVTRLPGGNSATNTPAELPLALASLKESGVNLVPVTVPGRQYLQERRAVAALAAQCGAQIAHTHGYRADVVDASALRAMGLPIVTTVHGFTGGDWRNRLYQLVQRRAFRRFNAVVAVSEVLARGLVASGVPAARVRVIPNAYAATAPLLPREAARAALGLPSDRFVVGWVGRVSYEKGLDVLLDALVLLRDRPIIVAVIGDGPQRPHLQARADALGLSAAVRWHGLVPEAAPLYRAFDVFALSSRTEGTPIALFEAMDALVPVVATQVGGVPAVVSSAEALLIPPEQPAALAEALHTVLSDPTAARTRASAARERLITTYSVESWVSRYDAVYREVLGLKA